MSVKAATSRGSREQGFRSARRSLRALALSAGDKVKLKTVAAKRGVTMAKLAHKWVKTLD